MSYTFEPIGLIHSPFKEKFGIPRQSLLAPCAHAKLVLTPPFDRPDTVRGLEAFSHIWILFVFHATAQRGWTPLIRPPRLGGNAKVGVFASRSTHRPNPIGLSLVELAGIEYDHGLRLRLNGTDLLDGTPVLDIKPYLPFIEAHSKAHSGFVDGPPPTLFVHWSKQAEATLLARPDLPTHFRQLVDEILAQDPRPAYQDDPNRVYGVKLFNMDIRFRINTRHAEVLEIRDSAQN